MSYAELNQQANRLARLLRAAGVGPDQLVGLVTARGVEMAVGILGILKAGGAYLPLDPDLPEERVTYLLEDSGCQVVVAMPPFAAALPFEGTVVDLTLALASGPDAFANVRAFCASWAGLVLLLGWTWSLAFHLLNGVWHLLQDIGLGFEPRQFVLNSWLVTIGSFVLAALVWAAALAQRGGA